MMTTAADHRAAEPGDRHRAQEMLLAKIGHGGLPALALVLIDSRRGDPVAATMTVGALLRAVPEVDWLTCHDLLRNAGLRDDQLLGELTPAQHRAMAHTLNRAPRPHPPA